MKQPLPELSEIIKDSYFTKEQAAHKLGISLQKLNELLEDDRKVPRQYKLYLQLFNKS